jgi:hypothetical protein
MSETQYLSGTCNIGEAEIQQRRRIGYIGLALTIITIIIYLTLIYSIKLAPIFGILVFIPAIISTIGLLQARKKFCAAYGLAHEQNVSLKLGVTRQVEDEISRRKDRNKALRIIFQSVVYAFIITILTLVVGVITSQLVS